MSDSSCRADKGVFLRKIFVQAAGGQIAAEAKTLKVTSAAFAIGSNDTSLPDGVKVSGRSTLVRARSTGTNCSLLFTSLCSSCAFLETQFLCLEFCSPPRRSTHSLCQLDSRSQEDIPPGHTPKVQAGHSWGCNSYVMNPGHHPKSPCIACVI